VVIPRSYTYRFVEIFLVGLASGIAASIMGGFLFFFILLAPRGY